MGNTQDLTDWLPVVFVAAAVATWTALAVAQFEHFAAVAAAAAEIVEEAVTATAAVMAGAVRQVAVVVGAEAETGLRAAGFPGAGLRMVAGEGQAVHQSGFEEGWLPAVLMFSSMPPVTVG